MIDNVEEIIANPKKYGVPTFEEFAKNPDGYLRESLNEKMARIDSSTKLFKNGLRKQFYRIAGYDCKSLDEVDRISNDMGINLLQCKIKPQIIPLGVDKCDLMVEFEAPLIEVIR